MSNELDRRSDILKKLLSVTSENGTLTVSTLDSLIKAVETLDGGFSVLLGKASGGDVVTTPAAGAYFDVTGMPSWHSALIASDIEKVLQVDSAGVFVAEYDRTSHIMVVTVPIAGTYRVTITGATFAATDQVVLYTNVSKDTRSIYPEDSAHTSTDPGTFVMGVRNDNAATAGALHNGDYSMIAVDRYGAAFGDARYINEQAIEVGAGNKGLGTQRVTLADDDTNTTAIKNATAIKSRSATAALVASSVVKAAAGTFYSLYVINTLAATQYIQVHNLAALPADGAVPFEVYPIMANSTLSISFGNGLTMGTGIIVCNSTTLATKTIGAANCMFYAIYE